MKLPPCPDCITGWFARLKWRLAEWRVDWELRHGHYKQYNSTDEMFEKEDKP